MKCPQCRKASPDAAKFCAPWRTSFAARRETLLDGERLRLAARHGSLRPVRAVREASPVDRALPWGRAVRDRRTIHGRDLNAAARGRMSARDEQAAARVGTSTAEGSLARRHGAPSSDHFLSEDA